MNQKEKETKSELRLDINRSLLTTNFTVFAIIVSLNPMLLKQSFLLPIQLTMAIPLLLSSIFARSRLAFARKTELWEEYGFFTFLISYYFLINVLGILLSATIGSSFGLIFLIFNILIAAAYSTLEVIDNKSKLNSRLKKDLLFATLLTLGGILPSLGLY